ncbi:MAG: hypothetical protein DRP35_03235 [Candidatus Zixiibacteriota bacterium]|nr:MAG: hypothetical protein DRP35_03235 [candidate division Zixibacteria bacterium]
MFRVIRARTLTCTILVAVFLLILSSTSTVQAQEVAIGQATATVLTALQVVASQTLQFGAAVLQGVPVSVAPADATCGHFTITGATTQELSINLQLPDYLWHGTASEEDRLVIAFGATDLIVDPDAAGIPGTPTINALAASDPFNIADVAPLANEVNLFLGGTIFPAVDQRVGAYSADIVCTVAYTGA